MRDHRRSSSSRGSPSLEPRLSSSTSSSENGIVYDGTGEPGRRADVGVRGDRIAAVGDLSSAKSGRVIDAKGRAVAPGFINVLSWATDSLIVDGRSQSDIRQGVTLEIFGEGWSMGPLNDAMKKEAKRSKGDIKFDIDWTTLGQYLDHLVARGVTPNVASFVGATTVRIHELGYADREPTPKSWRGWRTSSAKPCGRARSASVPPSFMRRRSTRRLPSSWR